MADRRIGSKLIGVGLVAAAAPPSPPTAAPLIKYPSNAWVREVVTDLARSVDNAPAVLDAAGIAIPEANIGRSLWTATKLAANAFAEEDHEGNTLHALRSPTQERIQANAGNHRGLPHQVLFDLTADPGEEQSLLATQPDQARTMPG